MAIEGHKLYPFQAEMLRSKNITSTSFPSRRSKSIVEMFARIALSRSWPPSKEEMRLQAYLYAKERWGI